MKQITISLTFNSHLEAEIIASAIRPEIKDNIPHTKVTISTLNNDLILIIRAKQTNTLRAACNSYLRWIQTAISINDIV